MSSLVWSNINGYYLIENINHFTAFRFGKHPTLKEYNGPTNYPTSKFKLMTNLSLNKNNYDIKYIFKGEFDGNGFQLTIKNVDGLDVPVLVDLFSVPLPYTTNSSVLNLTNNTTTVSKYIDMGPLTIGNEFTVEFWLNLTVNSPNSRLFETRPDITLSDNITIALDNVGNKLTLISRISSTSKIWGTSITIPLKIWTHIAIVYTLTSTLIYINGNLAGADRELIVPVMTRIYSVFGNNDGTVGSVGINGYFRDYKIWNTPLSIDVIKSRMFTTYNSPMTNLIRSYGGTTDLFANTSNLTSHVVTFNGTNQSGFLNQALTCGGAVTVESWVYLQSYTNASGASNSRIIEFNNGSGIDLFAIYINSSGNIVIYSGVSSFTSTAAFPLNIWTHIAITMSASGSTTIFLNGNFIQQSNITALVSKSRTNILWGKSGYTTDSLFKGKMTELRIWTVERTSSQILSNYELFLTGTIANLLLYISVQALRNTTNLNGVITDQTNQYSMNMILYSGLEYNSYWPLNISAQLCTYDASGNYNGILRNFASLQKNIPRPLGFSAVFDGLTQNYYTNNILSYLDIITIEVWINVSSLSTDYQRIVEIGKVGLSTNIILGIRSNGSIYFSSGGSLISFTTFTSSVIQTNTWTHVAVSCNSAGITNLYINGIFIQQITLVSPIKYASSNAISWGSNFAGNFKFTGMQSELRIWNFEGTSTQIYSNYTYSNILASITGLIFYISSYSLWNNTVNSITTTAYNSYTITLNGFIKYDGQLATIFDKTLLMGLLLNSSLNNTGTINTSITNSTATLGTLPVYGPGPKTGMTALTIDDGKYLDIPFHAALNFDYTTSFSFGGWFYMTAQRTLAYLMANTDSSRGIEIELNTNSTVLFGTLRKSSGITSSSPSAISDFKNAWHHLWFTYIPPNLYVYKDGLLIGTNINATTSFISTGNWQINRSNRNTTGSSTVKVADIRWYNGVIPASVAMDSVIVITPGIIISKVINGIISANIGVTTVTGGSNIYNFIWTNTDGASVITSQDLSQKVNLMVGSYTLYVYDSNGLTTSYTYNISSSTILTIIPGTIVDSYYTKKTGSISFNTSNGVGTLNYLWTSTLGGTPITTAQTTQSAPSLNGSAVFTGTNSTLGTDTSAVNIWNTSGFQSSAPVGTATFYKSFILSSDTSASIYANVDDNLTIFIDNVNIGYVNIGAVVKYNVTLTKGIHVIAITATNTGGPGYFSASLIDSSNNTIVHSDSTWVWTATYDSSISTQFSSTSITQNKLSSAIYTLTVTDSIGSTAINSFSVNKIWNIDIVSIRSNTISYIGSSSLNLTNVAQTQLTYPTLTLTNFSFTNSFTIEMFVYPTQTSQILFSIWNGLVSNNDMIYLKNNVLTQIIGNNIFNLTSSTTINLNTWNHIAISFDASTNTIYNAINGSVVSAIFGSSTIRDTKPICILFRNDGVSQYTTGYVDSLRISQSCIYKTTYTIPSTNLVDLWTVTGSTVFYENFDKNVTGGGTWSIDITPLKTSTVSHTGDNGLNITNLVQSLTTYPSLTISSLLYTSSFTIEFFVYPTNTIQSVFQVSNAKVLNNNILMLNTNIFYEIIGTISNQFTVTPPIIVGTWNHIAMSFDSTTNRIYGAINGIVLSNIYGVPSITQGKALNILWRDDTNSQYSTGYIDNIRISQSCIYTSNYIIPNQNQISLWSVKPNTLFYENFEVISISPGIITNATIYNTANASIKSLLVSGGSDIYTSYTWTSSASASVITTQDLNDKNNILGGDYTLTVVDTNGLTGSYTFYVGQPIFLSATVVDSTTINTGSITLTALGGFALKTYIWTYNSITVSTSQNLVGAVPGIYTCKVTSLPFRTSINVTVGGQAPISSWNIVIDALKTNTQSYSGGSSLDITTLTQSPTTYPSLSISAFSYTKDFTIEFFVYPTSGVQSLFQASKSKVTNNDLLLISSNTFYQFIGTVNNQFAVSSAVVVNSWNHIAISFNSVTNRLYGAINGIVNSNIYGVPTITQGKAINLLWRDDFNGQYTAGYIDNLRVSQSCIYTINYKVPSRTQVSLWGIGGTTLFYEDFSLAATTPVTTIITGGGIWNKDISPLISNIVSLSGNKSLEITTDSCLPTTLTYPSLLVSNLSYTQSFTIEFFYYPISASVFLTISDSGLLNNNLLYLGNGLLYLYKGASLNQFSIPGVSGNKWNHIALSFDATINKIYVGINGNVSSGSFGSLPFSDNLKPINFLYRNDSTTGYSTGYIDNLRISQSCIYTIPYSVPSITQIASWTQGGTTLYYENFDSYIPVITTLPTTINTGGGSWNSDISQFVQNTRSYKGTKSLELDSYITSLQTLAYPALYVPSLVYSQSFTIEFFIYPISVGIYFTISDTGISINNLLYVAPNTINLYKGTILSQLTTSSLIGGQWNHVAISYDSVTNKIYYATNGFVNSSSSFVGPLPLTDNKKLINFLNRNDSNTGFSYGNISNIRILQECKYIKTYAIPDPNFWTLGGTTLYNENFESVASYNNTIQVIPSSITTGGGNWNIDIYPLVTNKQLYKGSKSFEISTSTIPTTNTLSYPSLVVPSLVYTQSFTIEFFIYPISVGIYFTISDTGIVNNNLLYVAPNTINLWKGGGLTQLTTSSLIANQWNHIAVSFNSTNNRIYYATNGYVNSSTSFVGPMPFEFSIPKQINFLFRNDSTTGYSTGYLSNIRVLQECLYTQNYIIPNPLYWTLGGTTLYYENFESINQVIPPTLSPVINTGGGIWTVDIYPLTTNKLPFKGSKSFEISTSTIPTTNTLTYPSLYIPSLIYTQSFTIEFFIYPISVGIYFTISDTGLPNNNLLYVAPNTINLWKGAGLTQLTTSALIGGQWNHIAVSFNSTNNRIYYATNGYVNSSTSFIGPMPFTDNKKFINFLFRNDTPSSYYTAYLSNIRISQSCIYTQSYIVPDPTYWTLGGTTLFYENFESITASIIPSSTPTILTGGGIWGIDIKPLTNNKIPFKGTKSLEISSLTIPTTSNTLTYPSLFVPTLLYTQSFTIEFFVYPISIGIYFSISDSGILNNNFLYITNNIIYLYKGTSSQQFTFSSLFGNQWNHIAISYDSTNNKIYIALNGFINSSTNVIGPLPFTGNKFINFLSRSDGTTGLSPGYINNIRITQSCLYTQPYIIPDPTYWTLDSSTLFYENFESITAPIIPSSTPTILTGGGNWNIDIYPLTTNTKIYKGTKSLEISSLTIPITNTLTYPSLYVPSLVYTQSFTIEFFYYPISAGIYLTIGDGGIFQNNFLYVGNTITYLWKGAGQTQISTSSIIGNQWNHIAISFDSTNNKIYNVINGYVNFNTSVIGPLPFTGNKLINFLYRNDSTGGYSTGYINNIRVSQSCLYTQSYLIPDPTYWTLGGSVLYYENFESIQPQAIPSPIPTITTGGGTWNLNITSLITNNRPYKKTKSLEITSNTISTINTLTYPSLYIPSLVYTQSFTIEFFYYFTGGSILFSISDSGIFNNNLLLLNNASVNLWKGGSQLTLNSANILANQWNHIAFSFDATNNKIYYATNGYVNSNTSVIGPLPFTGNKLINFLYRNDSTGGYSTGYVNNIRVSQSCLYTQSYITPDPTYWTLSGSVLYYENFENYIAPIVTLSSSITTGGAQWNFDISNTISNKRPYSGTKSLDLTILSQKTLLYPSFIVPTLSFNQDFTIEFFHYNTGQNNIMSITSNGIQNNNNIYLYYYYLYFYKNNSLAQTNPIPYVLANQWNHVALSFNSTTNIIYIATNGYVIAIPSTNGVLPFTNNSLISLLYKNDGAGSYSRGYIDNIRVSQSCIYTNAYVIPNPNTWTLGGTTIFYENFESYTHPTQTIPNSVVTGGGSWNINISSLINNKVPYSGTKSLDITTLIKNRLTYPSLLVPSLSYSQDFTIEFFYYPTSISTIFTISNEGIANTNLLQLQNVLFYLYKGTTLNQFASQNILTNEWNHIALSFKISTNTIYNAVNGNVISATFGSLPFTGSKSINFLYRNDTGTGYSTGYIDNIRVSQSSIYTQSYIIPNPNTWSQTGTTLYFENFESYTAPVITSNSITTGGGVWNTDISTISTNTLPYNGTKSLDITLLNQTSITYPTLLISNLSYIQDFTIEFFYYPTNSINTLLSLTENGLSNTNFLNIINTVLYVYKPTTLQQLTIGTINAFQWNHIALSFKTSTNTIYIAINGSIASNVFYILPFTSPKPINLLFRNDGNSAYSPGFIDNVRVSQSCIYTNTYFVPDPTYWTLGGTTIFYENFDAVVSTAIAPSQSITTGGGTWNIDISALKTNIRSYKGNNSLDFTSLVQSTTTYPSLLVSGFSYSQSFTIEFFYYPTTSINTVFSISNASVLNTDLLNFVNTVINLYKGTTLTQYSTSTTLVNQWNHIALSFDSSTTKIYGAINGNVVSGTPGTLPFTGNKAINFLYRVDGVSSYSKGYIDNIRVSQNCIYTSSYLVPDPTNWTLGGSVLYYDNFDTAVAPITFVPTIGGGNWNIDLALYKTNIFSYSGTNSLKILTTAQNILTYPSFIVPILSFSQSFTIELFYYPTEALQQIFSIWNGVSNNNDMLFLHSNVIYQIRGGTSNTLGGAVGINLFSWNHVAISFDFTTNRIYCAINGTVTSAVYGNVTMTSNRAINLLFRNDGGGQYSRGYIDNIRVSQSCIYTTTYTIPTPTTIASTWTLGGTTIFYENFETTTTPISQVNAITGGGNWNIDISLYQSTTQPYKGAQSLDSSLLTQNILKYPSLYVPSLIYTQSYTIEFFYYPTSASTLFSITNNGTPLNDTVYFQNTILYYYKGSTSNQLSMPPLLGNEWNHIAFSFDATSNTIYCAINGNVTSRSAPTFPITTQKVINLLYKGDIFDVSNNYSPAYSSGYIDNIRVSQSCIYTNTYILPNTNIWTLGGTTLFYENFESTAITTPVATTITTGGGTWNQDISTIISNVKPYSGTKSLDISAVTNNTLKYPSFIVPSLIFTQSFTIEMFYYNTGVNTIFSISNNGFVNTNTLYFQNTILYIYKNNTTTLSFNTQRLIGNEWNHIALSFDATNNILYSAINGNVISTTYGPLPFTSSKLINLLYRNDSSGSYSYGYIDNVRVSQSCIYTNSYIVPNPNTWSLGGTTIFYENFESFTYTQTIPNPINTGGGSWNQDLSKIISTVKSYSGTKSLDTGLTIANVLKYPSFIVPALNYSQSFTIEFFYYSTGIATIFSISNNGYQNQNCLYFSNSNVFPVYIYKTGVATLGINLQSVIINEWNHIAMSFDAVNNILYLAVNGNVISTPYGPLPFTGSKAISLLYKNDGGANYSYGYIDNLRVSQECIYINAYTIPNSNTWSLGGTTIFYENFESYIYPIQTIPNPINTGGGTWNQDISKIISTTKAYSGTKSLDTSLLITNTLTYPSFIVPTLNYLQSFTIEMFYYNTGANTIFSITNNGYQNVNCLYFSSPSFQPVYIYKNNTATLGVNIQSIIGNEWNHIAFSFDAVNNIVYFAVNGNVFSSAYGPLPFTGLKAINLLSRNDGSGGYSYGYVDNLRVSQTCIYTSAYTLPNPNTWSLGGSTVFYENFESYIHPVQTIPNPINKGGGTWNQDISKIISTTKAYSGTKSLDTSLLIANTLKYPSFIVPTLNYLQSFTIEMFYFNSGVNAIFSITNNGFQNTNCLYFSSPSFQPVYIFKDNTVTLGVNMQPLVSNEWNHIAFSFDAINNIVYFAVNGNVTSATYGPLPFTGSKAINLLSRSDGSGGYSYGYIDNLRVSQTCIYTSAYTVPNPNIWSLGGSTVFYENFESYVYPVQTIPSSIIKGGGLWKKDISSLISTVKPYSGLKSLDLSSVAQNTLKYPSFVVPSLNFSQSFTIEMFYFNNGNYTLFSITNNGIQNTNCLYFNNRNSAPVYIYKTGSAAISYNVQQFVPNEWNHIALSYNATTNTAYSAINGNVTSFPINGFLFTGNNAIDLLRKNDGSNNYSTGFIDNIRVSQSCLYTDNYLIPNPSTWTLGGNTIFYEDFESYTPSSAIIPSNSNVSPNNPIHVISFNGSNQSGSLTISTFTIGGALTIEEWIYYSPSTNIAYTIFSMTTGINGANGVILSTNSSNNLVINIAGTISTFTNITLVINTWTHVAFTLSNTGLAKLYINGVFKQQLQLSVVNAIARSLIYWGKSSYAADPLFTGKQTELRVWNIERQSADILSNYNLILPNQTGLQLYISSTAIATTISSGNILDTTGNYTMVMTNYITYLQDFILTTIITNPINIPYVVTGSISGIWSVDISSKINNNKAYTGTKSLDLTTTTQNTFKYPSLLVPALVYNKSFTIEFFFYYTGGSTILSLSNNGIQNNNALYYQNTYILYYKSTSRNQFNIQNILGSEWNHIALSYDSTTNLLYSAINGNVISQNVGILPFTANKAINFLCRTDGKTDDGGVYSTGYIDNIRISQSCLYTSNYIIPDPSNWIVGGTTLYIENFESYTSTITATVPNTITTGGGSWNIDISSLVSKKRSYTGVKALNLMYSVTYNTLKFPSLFVPTLNYNQNFTIEFFYYSSSTNTLLSISNNGIVNKDTLYLQNALMYLFRGTTQTNFTTQTVFNSDWNHIAISFDSINNILYSAINGNVASINYGPLPFSTTKSINLLYRNDSSGSYSTGIIDSIRVSQECIYIGQYVVPNPNIWTLGGTTLYYENFESFTYPVQTIPSSITTGGATWNIDISKYITTYKPYSGSKSLEMISITQNVLNYPSFLVPTLNCNQNFTIEMFYYPTNYNSIFSISSNGVQNNNVLYYNFFTNTPTYLYKGSALTSFTTQQLVLNEWNHVALSFNSSTNTLYSAINGNVTSLIVGILPFTSKSPINLLYRGDGSTFYSTGYVDNIRVSQSCIYTDAYILPNPNIWSLGGATIFYENFESVNTLAQPTNTIVNSGATWNIDLSQYTTNAKPYSGLKSLEIIALLNTTISYPSFIVPTLSFTQSFTIEFFYYNTGVNTILSITDTGIKNNNVLYYQNRLLQVYKGAVLNQITVPSLLGNQWNHIALSFDSSQNKLYIANNGYVLSASFGSLPFSSTKVINLLYHNDGSGLYSTGYIDSIRVSQTCIYTDSYLVPNPNSWSFGGSTLFHENFENVSQILDSTTAIITGGGTWNIDISSLKSSVRPYTDTRSLDLTSLVQSSKTYPSITVPSLVYTQSFTIEFFYYPTNTVNTVISVSNKNVLNSDTFYLNTSLFGLYKDASLKSLILPVFVLSEWNHVALAFDSISGRTYCVVNGNLVYGLYGVLPINSPNNINLLYRVDTSSYSVGYIDNVRVSQACLYNTNNYLVPNPVNWTLGGTTIFYENFENFSIISGTTTNVTTFGGTDGYIGVTGLSGISSNLVTYSWSTIDGTTITTQDLTAKSGLSAGSYQLSITDNTGFTNSYTYVIYQPMMITLTKTNSSTGINGSITLDIQGGFVVKTFSWSFNGVKFSNLKNLTNLEIGTYICIVTSGSFTSSVSTIIVGIAKP